MATATFDDILAAQRETNEILNKKSSLDGRTQAGKALLDAQRETTSVLSGELQDLKGKQPSPSQIKETNKDTQNAQDARFGALGKIFKTQIGKLTNAFSNLNKAAKGGIIGALTALGLFALADFLESPTFEKIREIVVEKLPPLLDRIYKNILKPVLDFFVPKFQKFFGDLLDFLEDPSFGGLFDLIAENKVAVASLAALLAPKLFLKGLQLGFVALKSSVAALGAALTPLLAPVAAAIGVVGGLVMLFFGLKEAFDVIVDDLVAGELTLGTLGKAVLAFLGGLAKLPTMLFNMLVPEDIREKMSVGLGDFIDGTVKFIKTIPDLFMEFIFKPLKDGFSFVKEKFVEFLNSKFVQDILGYIDENILEPFRLQFAIIKRSVSEKLNAVSNFFNDILAPFQRAIRAFKETDGFLPTKLGAAMDAFGDPNYFGPQTMGETYGFAGDRMPRTELMQLMTGNLDTRTGQRFAAASLDKAGRDATPVAMVTNVNNIDASSGKGATSNNFSNTPITDKSDTNRNH